MGLEGPITDAIRTTLSTPWNDRNGRVVPKNEDVALLNGAVRLDATFLYADLAHSTRLVRTLKDSAAAKVVRAYLSSMTRLVNAHGGSVRSFDGDRVMGVFVGEDQASDAAKCALKMNYVVLKLLQPMAEAKFPQLKAEGISIRHCAGVAKANVLVVRGGVRDSNDLVFVGSAPNIAAKLSEIRNYPYCTYITWHVYEALNANSKIGSGNRNMWTKIKRELAGETWDCYKSNWHWGP